MRISPVIGFLLISVLAFAEGSRELAPNANIVVSGNNTTDVAALLIDNSEYNSFASYTNPDPNSRLYIHITDPENECIFLGFTFGHVNQTSQTPPRLDFEYRVRDPNGNVVFGPVTVPTTGGNIQDWSEATTGPMQIYGAGGYDAMQITSADLMSQGWSGAGDYFIEFDYAGSGTGLLIDFWDISVSDCSQSVLEEKKGRIWSYNWAIFAINDFGFPLRPFNGAFFVCAPDPDDPDAAFITKIDFNGADFRPAAFNVAFNSFGSMNTGNVMTDRRSVEGLNATQAEYEVFLNDPVDLCKTGETGDIELLGVSRCDAEDYCIKYIASKEGQIDLLLDFDGPDDVYTPGSTDVMIAIDVPADEVGVPSCVSWDGLDGQGNALPENTATSIPVVIAYAQGIYHFPIYDAEFMTAGVTVEAVRPAGPKPLLYYDDSQISVASGSGEPAVQLSGCVTPCHRWTVFNDPNIPGFGNLNTINSWWFSQRVLRSEVFFLPAYLACSISGPSGLCEGETTMLTWEPNVEPDSADAPEIVSVQWTGPDILGNTMGSVVTIGSAGTYGTLITWLTPLGDTCLTMCEQTVEVNPITTGSFDTLILSGDVIEINGESFSEGGQFIQVLTGSNGCDSILTIRISILQTAVHFNLDDCNSYPSIGTDSIYTEFTPEYPEPISCATLDASIAYRENPGTNRHSCTPGVFDSPAMCISARAECNYVPGDEKSFVFEVTVIPAADTAVHVTGLSFWERAPEMYDWIDGPSGPNNYPTWYGIRVLKNGTEIYQQSGIATTTDWTLEEFSFIDEEEFIVAEESVFRFELLGYCHVGNGEPVAAWDLDEISIQASCALTPQMTSHISGRVFTDYGARIRDVEIALSGDALFTNPVLAMTDPQGAFLFPDNIAGNPYYLRAGKNTDFLEGVSTLDIIQIQKHLLGRKKFDSPIQYLAADVTGNEVVSTLDMVDIRKLILGVNTEFPGNTSWRIGKAGQILPLTTPWNFQETIFIPGLGEDLENVNFLAVKVGDVNRSFDGLANAIETRSARTVVLETEDRFVRAGETVSVPVTSPTFRSVSGFQFALNLKDAKCTGIGNGALDMANAFAMHQDGRTVRFSWYDIDQKNAAPDDVLFTLRIVAQSDGYLSELVAGLSEALHAEAYSEAGDAVIGLQFGFSAREVQLAPEEAWILNSPNPFAGETHVRFYLPEATAATIRISDISGRLLKVISDDFERGEHVLTIYADELEGSGHVLICQLTCPGVHQVVRMLKVE